MCERICGIFIKLLVCLRSLKQAETVGYWSDIVLSTYDLSQRSPMFPKCSSVNTRQKYALVVNVTLYLSDMYILTSFIQIFCVLSLLLNIELFKN